MFICVSLNPAIDKRLELASVSRGRVIRARTARSFAGGKSTHVAMVLRTLGEKPQWVGPCGGPTGAELIAGLSALGIDAHPCRTEQTTRTNLELIEDDGTVTEILEPGCTPSTAEFLELEKMCGRLFSSKDSVIFSGSLPSGAPPETYATLVALAHKADCKTFIDLSGEPLRFALGTRPEFVKPNWDEAAALLGEGIGSRTLTSAAAAVQKLMTLGARRAAISMGAEGLLYCAGESSTLLWAPAISLQPKSTVGCGDAAMAGFARAIASDSSPEETLRLAAACATANCLAESPGAAKLDDIRKFQSQVEVRVLASSG